MSRVIGANEIASASRCQRYGVSRPIRDRVFNIGGADARRGALSASQCAHRMVCIVKGYTVAKPKKPTNAEHVSAFFAELAEAVPGTPETSQWLVELQRRARGKRAGWIVEAEAYLQGTSKNRGMMAG